MVCIYITGILKKLSSSTCKPYNTLVTLHSITKQEIEAFSFCTDQSRSQHNRWQNNQQTTKLGEITYFQSLGSLLLSVLTTARRLQPQTNSNQHKRPAAGIKKKKVPSKELNHQRKPAMVGGAAAKRHADTGKRRTEPVFDSHLMFKNTLLQVMNAVFMCSLFVDRPPPILSLLVPLAFKGAMADLMLAAASFKWCCWLSVTFFSLYAEYFTSEFLFQWPVNSRYDAGVYFW